MSARSASVMGRGCAVDGFRLGASEGMKCFELVVAIASTYSSLDFLSMGYRLL